jgi:small subunit ribosomal protein S21
MTSERLDTNLGTLLACATGREPAVRNKPALVSQRGSETGLTEIRLKKGESVDKALRRLKKKIDREGTLKEVRNHRHFEKPSERRRRKMKAARFSAMLSARYADL